MGSFQLPVHRAAPLVLQENIQRPRGPRAAEIAVAVGTLRPRVLPIPQTVHLVQVVCSHPAQALQFVVIAL